jgi:hypothetical protein
MPGRRLRAAPQDNSGYARTCFRGRRALPRELIITLEIKAARLTIEPGSRRIAESRTATEFANL